MKGMPKWFACAVILALGATLAGCTAKAVDKGWELCYEPPEMQATEEQCSITVYEFQDDRPEQAMVGCEYNAIGTIVERYQTARPIAQVVTDAIVSNLEAQGFTVVRSSGWNLSPDTLRSVATELALGGKIRACWVERQPKNYGGTYIGYLGANMTSNINLHVVIASPSGKEILWEGDLVASDTYRHDHAIFTDSMPKPQEMLENVLKEAVDQLATNLDIQRAIRFEVRPMFGLAIDF
jgi:uncharacterized lipoprotein YajG